MSKFEDTPAGTLWNNTLSQINSVFGRLAYVASLRDQNTGKYEHFGLAQSIGEKQANNAVRESHAQVFAAWLALGKDRGSRAVFVNCPLGGALGHRQVAPYLA